MKPLSPIHLASCALLAVAGLLVGGCDGGVWVSGRVVDLEDRPIVGARVSLTHATGWSFDGVTNGAGCFSVGGVTAPGRYFYDLRAELAGYQMAIAKVATGQSNYLVITLAPTISTRGSAISSQKTDPCPHPAHGRS